MPVEWRSVKNNADALIFHRIFATKSLRNGGKCENPYIKDFRIALCAAGVTKSLFIASQIFI